MSDSETIDHKRSVRFPAEWESHRGTWLSWPHPEGQSFPGDWTEQVGPELSELVAGLIGGEQVWINVRDAAHRNIARSALGDLVDHPALHFVEIPTDEPWCRDHGPTFVQHDNETGGAVCWVYNAWGGKYPPYDQDARAGSAMAAAVGVQQSVSELICEGGAYDSDGRGNLLVSRPCLTSLGRNSECSLAKIETELSQQLGSNNIWWVEGDLVGDDTDGHVDCLARFVPGDKILYAVPHAEDSANIEGLNALRISLESISRQGGFDLVPLPNPAPIFLDGAQLPATYTNFYIANHAVLVPTFGIEESDARALEVIGQHFPDRVTLGVRSDTILWGLGAVHCLTQQIPAFVPEPTTSLHED